MNIKDLNLKRRFARCRRHPNGFTIVEVSVAIVIIGLICSTVLLIIKHNMIALSESRLKMEAFELARENMEKLLTASSISEMDDYGISEKNPNIEWETLVETFDDPNGGKMWVRAICSATYPDANDQPQTIELTHWLTDVSQNVMDQILKDKEQLDANEPNSPYDANIPGTGSNPNRTNPNMDPILQEPIKNLPK